MAEKKFKVLFITHDTGNYGASRSLQVLLKNYPQADADLIVQKRFLGRHDHEALRERFGGRIGKIREAYLPYDPCHQYRREGIFPFLFTLYDVFFSRPNIRRVHDFIRNGGYDIVHLNSLVLHPLICEEFPFIIHIREVFDGSSPAAVESVKKAKGVIFIDEAAKGPFRNVPLRNSVILNNPVDMTPLASAPQYRPNRMGMDAERHTIFSMIGVASEKKGTEFVIRCFMKLGDSNARLLIVGDREKAALARYRWLARNDRRVIFWGQEPDIRKIYSISDYIFRGEAFHCIGRTMYEGLYAGCKVIIPGLNEDVNRIFEYDTFKDSIYLYAPRNSRELKQLIEKLSTRKISNRRYFSNVDSYVKNFHKFVITALNK